MKKLTLLLAAFLTVGAAQAQPMEGPNPMDQEPIELSMEDPLLAGQFFDEPMDIPMQDFGVEPAGAPDMGPGEEMPPLREEMFSDSGHGRKQLLKELQLTAEQMKKIKDIRMKTAKEMIDLSSAMKKKRLDMRGIMDADAPKRSDVEKLTRELADLQVQIRMLGFDTRMGIMNVLTDEQKAKFKELAAERRDGMKMKFRGQMKQRMHRGE